MLRASLRIDPDQGGRPEELRADATLENAGEEALEIRPVLLSSPSLALEIVDRDGAPVLLLPPPVPGGPESSLVLGPGESHAAELGSFLPPWTDPGTYRVRVRYQGDGEAVVSEWVTVVVGTG